MRQGPQRGERIITALDFFKNEAAKANAAKIEGKRRHAAVVEYQSATGKLYRWYWSGARYEDRPNPEEERCTMYKFSGVYRAS